MYFFVMFLSLVAASSNPVVINRMAVIVGKHVVKSNDIDLDVRVTEFLNKEQLNLGPEERRRSAERLIDQELIRQELITGGFRRPADDEAKALETQFVRDRYEGSDVRLRDVLKRYDLTEEDLRAKLLWQLTVLRFIDQRFRNGVLVSDDEVRAYYDQHFDELRRQNAKNTSFEAAQEEIRNSLEGERIDQNFNTWLGQARKRTRIQYLEDAFK
jgi:peptidyl-prolyl cis-trans isomerase SurA